tara:strand:+ start:1865 stop:1996 length:132 start_codon:yes stop_codon:yes gene_type:complete
MTFEIIHSIVSCVGAVTILYGVSLLGEKVILSLIAKIKTSNND